MRNLLWLGAVLSVLHISTAQTSPCDGQGCYPDIGDLLVGREDRLTATSTCGQKGPENYCIVSHLKDEEKCFICDARDQSTNHNVENVITTFRERLGTWWQSENGVDKVSIRLDLETAFHFTHLIMTFKTFRPAAMIIERSNDYGKTWRVYRYFAYDCNEFYPDMPLFPPREIDEVICDSRYSLIEPSTEGELIYKVLEPSLIPFDDPYSPRIQDLLTITNLRINFTHMHTLGDDLLDNRENIKEKYYYSLYELIVRGNCFCYGHADECRPIDASLERPDLVRRDLFQVNGRCVCRHNTQGLNCNECLPFYHDQPWRPADRGQPNECKRCNCNNHADECHFDAAVYAATDGESGGVCDNCRDNTIGRNCELCRPFFYHHPERDIRDPNVCEACNCEVAGSLNDGMCDGRTDSDLGMIAGQCRCRQYVEGERCDRCKPGYYNLDETNDFGCTPCDCDSLGTLDGSNQCDPTTGQCICKRHTTGRRCDQCAPQTWGLSADSGGCRDCNCDVGGSYNNDCDDSTGQCDCRPHITARQCSIAEAGFFVPFLDHYTFEAEDVYGNENTFRYNQKYAPPMIWTGYGFKMVRANGIIEFIVSGLPASMDYDFVLRYVPYNDVTVDNVKVTIIRPNAGNIPVGSPCDNTKPGDDDWVASLRGHPTSFENLGSHCLEMEYNYAVRFEFPDGMEGINIDSLVLVANYSGISMFHGSIAGAERSREFDELKCQDRAMQLPKQPQNEICAGLVFSMNAILHDGALACDCDPQGSVSSICEKNGGQCVCKPNVMGRKCDKCVPGTFGLGPDGCKPCDCNVEGARSPDVEYCNTETGECTCRNGGITGRQCDQCKVGFYKFPECIPCECNGHAEECNQDTGMCLNCGQHTIGDHCEFCEDGYYGDPRLGSQDQCKPCMCPGGPDSSRQFAQTCSETYDPLTGTNQVLCDCMPQYTGETCNQCAPGHYGNPHAAGGQCIACECNGNVDPSNPGACDASTGECTACLHDTAGPHCEVCRDFYYGNALSKDCRLCACDVAGTEPSQCVGGHCHCDMNTGQCPCLPNMTGRRCESCLPNHYRGSNGEGCIPCNCHETNSLGATCNEYTGQCECKDGFGGLTCGDCADGYWGNPNIACYECDCDPLGSAHVQCDRATGQCPCIEGVGGRYCDRCKRGFTGDIPSCEPCGECFDNWDKIISDLKERTEKAIAHAQAIEETGITGAYEDDFTKIEKTLKEIEDILAKLDEAAEGDNFRDVIDDIRDKLSTQEKRLDKMEKDMEKLRSDDESINDWLEKSEDELNQMREKLDGLKEEKRNISKASPAAAYKQVEDAAQRSENAERAAKAATTEPGSLVKQSEDVRAEVELTFASKLEEFDDKRQQVEADLEDNKAKVEELSLADINRDVCGQATEECDDTCGGAGCEHCGGLGCKGAVTNADEAKARAEKTKEILDGLTADTTDLHIRIQVTKENAKEAKQIAEDARRQADEVESKVKDRNAKIRDLIRQIRQFLTDDRAKPEEIEALAREVLAMTLRADRDEIDSRAKIINDLVNSLPDVDNILDTTQDDLDRANALLAAAEKAKADAAAVAGDARAVSEALEQAENASTLAKAARDKAQINIDLAQQTINDIVGIAAEITDAVDGIDEDVKRLEDRLKAIESKIVDNSVNVENAIQQTAMAMDTAQAAKDALEAEAGLIRSANGKINEKKGQVDRLTKLRKDAEALQETINGNLDKLDELNEKFDEQERELTTKSSELESLLAEVERLYASIVDKEADIRLC
ncbi:laminin subunit beta-1-like [Styela clava]